MEVERVKVFNFENAIRAMRNPMESYDKSDSMFYIADLSDHGRMSWDELVREAADLWGIDVGDVDAFLDKHSKCITDYMFEFNLIGPKDMELAKKLIKSGSEHRKFLRDIGVSMMITAPDYWWKEMSTYTVGVQSANSTSTMHKILSKEITKDLFETDDYLPEVEDEYFLVAIEMCEKLRKKYLDTKDKKYWKALIRLLPMGWSYTRSWTANYETLRNIYHQRKGHKLTEWHTFLDEIEKLPYAKEFIVE